MAKRITEHLPLPLFNWLKCPIVSGFISFGCVGIALAGVPQQRCSTLEYSNFTDHQLAYSGDYQFARSHDQKLIALYQYFESKSLATFKLWERQTGKLLKAQKLESYQERSGQVSLDFSPDDRIVYLSGMSNGVPFWNLIDNRLVASPCETAMGITDVQFSDDQTVAYTSTIDGFQSLCRTDKAERVALLSYAGGDFLFDKANKHLYARFAAVSSDSYQNLLADIEPHSRAFFTLYPSPVWDHPYQTRPTNHSFAALFLGEPPNYRLLIAKSQEATLQVSLWDYAGNSTPKNLYQRELTIPALAATKQPIARNWGRWQQSLDGNQAAFLSKSGMVLVFDIASGQLRWQTQLTQAYSKEKSENYQFVSGALETQSPDLVIEQSDPPTLLFFDWKSGKKRSLTTPEPFKITHFPHEYGPYLLFDPPPTAKDKGRWLLLNWKTGQQQLITLPERFYAPLAQIPQTSLILFGDDDYSTHPKPYALALYDWKTGKQRLMDMPFANDGSHDPEYLSLNNQHHLLFRIRHRNHNNKQHQTNTSFRLVNIENQHYQTLMDHELLLDSSLIRDEKDQPILETLIYDELNRQTLLCHLPLSAIH